MILIISKLLIIYKIIKFKNEKDKKQCQYKYNQQLQ